jgi:hypothetical protein
MADVNNSLRQALFDTISGLLSVDQSARSSAEEQVKALEVTDDYGVHLCELTLEPSGALPIRQMSALLLKQYIDSHWSQDGEKFRPPETLPHAKATIRQMLPMGLKESISKVRNTVAFSLSAIAHWDWPDHWPQLFDILMAAMKGQDEFAVQGAVRVLKELSRDLTDSQIPTVAPVILPDIYRIFCESDRYTVRTRARAVEIFTSLVSMICTIGEINKGLQKSLLNPVLTTFSEALVAALTVPDSHSSDPGLKTEVLKALTVLVKNVPKQMSTWLPQILPPVWSTLTTSAEKYVKDVVNESGEEEEIVDSDGEVLGFENLVFAIFEFVHALVETSKFKGAVKSGLADLVYYIVLYMQITEEQCQKWTDNPDSFVEDEDEDTFAYSVRISSQDLLMALCEEFPEESCVSLAQTIERHLGESEQRRRNSQEEWWKIHEASMLALGSAQEVIESQIKAGKVQFDIGSFLQNVVLADLNSPVHPFLLGRCLWVGSKFPSSLPPQAITSFLEGTVRGLQADQPHPVRISAVRAIWGFFSHLRSKSALETSKTLLAPMLPATVDGLANMCTTFQHSSEILGLVLENLAVVLSCNQKFTSSVESKVTPLTIAMFLQYNSDPVITSVSQDIFKVLSQNQECVLPLQTKLVPTLVSILQNQDGKVPSGLQSVTLDVLQTLVRSSPKPLSEQLMQAAFPAAIHIIMNTDDNSVLQSGGECLRAYISSSPDQIAAFTDPSGKTGLQHIVEVAGHLLNPVGSEFSATFVGRLVTCLIQRTGDRLGDNLDHLLKAVLSKLRGAETLSVIQSLVLVYAQLIHSRLDGVLTFLSSVPGPTGNSALHFVMTEWVTRQHLFYGAYETKVSLTALAKLLQHGVNNNDDRLNEITVKGDQIFSENGRPRTRSAKVAVPDQWTQVPLLAKLLKLMVAELSSMMEAAADDDYEEDDSGDEYDSQDSDAENCLNNSGGIDLSKLLDPGRDNNGYDEFLDDEEDPDALSDPLYSINLKQYLVSFLTDFIRQPCFQHFTPHLNMMEQKTLQQLANSS